MLNKKEWLEKGDYLDEELHERENVFNMLMSQMVNSMKIS